MTASARIVLRHCRWVSVLLTLRCVTHLQLDFVRGWWAPHFKTQNRPAPSSPRGSVAASGLCPHSVPSRRPEPVPSGRLWHRPRSSVCRQDLPSCSSREGLGYSWPWCSRKTEARPPGTRALASGGLPGPPGTSSSRVEVVAGPSRSQGSEPTAEDPRAPCIDLLLSASYP